MHDSADRTADAALTSAPEKALTLVQSYANAKCGGSISACPPITLTIGGAENLGAASIPDADALLDQAATISNSAGDIPLDQISRTEQLYTTNVAWIPLAQGTFAQVIRRNVSNLTYSADRHISLMTWQRAYLIA